MKYLLPEQLGGVEVELLTDTPGPGDTVDVVVASGALAGLTLEIELRWLTPVAPPIPKEPPPGAYQIGEVTAFSDGDPDTDARWRVLGVLHNWLRWTQVWERFGGPDVTIRPLCPAPEPVALPWRDECATGVGIALEIQQRDSDDHVPVIIRGHGCVYLDGEAARQAAAALWTAAGEP